MRWIVPHIVGKDEVNLALNNRIKSEEPIDIAFRGISASRIEVPEDTSSTWRLGAREAPEVPRYLILGFQTNTENNQERNPTQFEHSNLANLNVRLNERQNHNVEYLTNFGSSQCSRVYLDGMKFEDKLYNVESTGNETTSAPGIDMVDYKALIPIFVVNLSEQPDKVKHFFIRNYKSC